MSFGRSSAEKQNDAKIQGITQQQQDIANSASNRSDKTFKWFKETSKPVKDFWTSILEGDRSKIMEKLGPEISTIKDTYKGEREANTALTPRSGLRSSGYADSLDREASQIGDTVLTARPTAANELMQLSSLFSGTSLSEGGQALGGLNSATSNLFGINQEEQRAREAKANFWGQLGAGAGSLAGGLFFGKFGK